MTVEMCLEKIKKHSQVDYMRVKKSLNDSFNPNVFSLISDLYSGKYTSGDGFVFPRVLDDESLSCLSAHLFESMCKSLNLTGKQSIVFAMLVAPSMSVSVRGIFGDHINSLTHKQRSILGKLVQDLTTYRNLDEYLDHDIWLG